MKKFVVIGGGAIGLSVAYHLGCRGVSDVVLLERHQLTSGTSWHAAGIVGPLRATPKMTQLAMYAHECFQTLEIKTGLSTGYKRTGGYWLARRDERMDELHRTASIGNHFGLNCAIVNARQLSDELPFLNVETHAGGISVAEDANVNPVDLCMAYAQAARESGVQIRENCEVAQIVTDNAQIIGVTLVNGEVLEADAVALCAGAWSKPLAAAAGLHLPLQAVEHMYVVTEPVDSTARHPLPDPFPVIRDLDSGIYIKGDSGGKLIVGGFEPEAKCWDANGPAGQRPFIEFSEDWNQFEPFMHAALKLMPQLDKVGIQRFMNGPESFTADTKPLVGMAPAVDGLFVAAGMNSVGIMSSAGIGRVLADWMVDKRAPTDLWEVDIARSDPVTASDSHMRHRMREAVADLFSMHWPYKQQSAGRLLHKSVLHNRWQSLGAVFGVTGGLERGLWFARDDNEKTLPYSIAVQSWQGIAEREAAQLREGVALLDLSAFSKFDVYGADALRCLQKMAVANVDEVVGRAVYTTLLNESGGIEADVTITRLDSNRFRLTSGGNTRFRDLALLRRSAHGFSVQVNDVTEQEVVLGVMGDTARELMASISQDNWLDFPFATGRQVIVGGVECFATRISYIGEYGWELSIPSARADRVFDAIVDGGAQPLGQHALNSCRIEKRFLHWGHDIGPDLSPLEAGLSWTVDWTKEFTGKRSLLNQRESGVTRRLCLFHAMGEPLLLHDEPIYLNDKIVGLTTSGTRGVRTGKSLAMGLIDLTMPENNPHAVPSDFSKYSFDIEVAGKRYPATRLDRAAYDPENRYSR